MSDPKQEQQPEQQPEQFSEGHEGADEFYLTPSSQPEPQLRKSKRVKFIPQQRALDLN